MISSFQVGDVRIGSGNLFLIAGPCVIESEEHAIRMAEIIKGVTKALGFPFIFKASYDKANRTSIRSFRGPGIKEGLRILKKIKDEVQLPVLTDVHEVSDVAKVAEVVDVLQIPAFLCRQTDLVVAAALSGRPVNIKKGQFVSPWDMRHAVEKCREAGNTQVFLTERGTSFGYNNLDCGYAFAIDHAQVRAGSFRRDTFRATAFGAGRRWRPRGAVVAASPSSFRCWRVRQLLLAWMASSWKCTTIPRKRNPMERMRSNPRSFARC